MTAPDNREIKAVAKARENGVAIVGNQVFEGSKYAPHLYQFTRQKYLLLNHYHAGLPLEEAALKVNMDIEDAARFIDSPKAVEWLEKEAILDYKKQKWADGREWISVGDDCIEGRKHLAKDQQVIFSAFGERFAPKPRGEMGDGKRTVINFNFTPESVKEALARQNIIDAEVA